MKRKIRVRLWRYAGAGIIHRQAHLLRRPLLLSPGDNVILVGCSSDQTLQEVGNLIGDAGEILVVEPYSAHRSKLRPKKTEATVRIDNRAAWSDTGTLRFGEKDTDSTSGRVLDNSADHTWTANDYDRDFSIKATKLDALADEYNFNPNYIEILTNGTEPEVLSGASSLLNNSQPKLLLKTYGFGGSQTASRIGELLERLQAVEYQYAFAPMRPLPRQIESQDVDGDLFAWAE